MIKKILSVFGPVLIVLAGFAVIGVLFATRPKAEQKDPAKKVPQVTVAHLKAQNPNISFQTTGRVIPAQTIVVTPQVSGKITHLSRNLQPGGRLQRDQLPAARVQRDAAANPPPPTQIHPRTTARAVSVSGNTQWFLKLKIKFVGNNTK